ncbi:MAG: hydrogen peroxide-inducible genes activator [Myxococcota bacterium]
MSTPTLRQMEYIVAVAEHRQFSEAARRLAVSQPALSKQIKEVEKFLGVTIFERARPRLLITADGVRVVEQCRRVLREAEELSAIARAMGGPLERRLELGVIPTIAPFMLPGLMNALQARHPRLQVILHEGRTDALVQRTRHGELDLLLLALPVDDEGLTGVDLFEEPFVLAAPKSHPLAKPEAATREELAGASLLLMEEGHCFRAHALDVCASAGAKEDHAIRSASITTMALMVEHGMGATLIPAMAMEKIFGDGRRIVARSFGPGGPSRRLGLRWRPSSARADEFRALADVLAEQAGEMLRQPSYPVHGAPLSLRPLR